MGMKLKKDFWKKITNNGIGHKLEQNKVSPNTPM